MKKQLVMIFVTLFVAYLAYYSLNQQVQAKNEISYAVDRVLNGKSFTLKTGETVRLASIQVPNIRETHGLKRAGEPMGVQSHQALIDLVQNQPLTFRYGPQQEDRKGRLIVLAYLPDGRNVQAEMIRQGWAMVYPFPDLRDVLPGWLKLEAEARKAKRGIWQHDYWNPQSAEGVETGGKERYLLVEGVVKKAAKVKGGWFLNFDDDWKTDFTGVINKDDAKAHFKKYDVKGLEGKRVRLRGWTYRYNGPAMDLHQPEQIEILEK